MVNPFPSGTPEHAAWTAGFTAARAARDHEGIDETRTAWRRGFSAGGGGPGPDDGKCPHATGTRRADWHAGWLARDCESNDDFMQGSDACLELAARLRWERVAALWEELNPGRRLDWDPGEAYRWRAAWDRID